MGHGLPLKCRHGEEVDMRDFGPCQDCSEHAPGECPNLRPCDLCESENELLAFQLIERVTPLLHEIIHVELARAAMSGAPVPGPSSRTIEPGTRLAPKQTPVANDRIAALYESLDALHVSLERVKESIRRLRGCRTRREELAQEAKEAG